MVEVRFRRWRLGYDIVRDLKEGRTSLHKRLPIFKGKGTGRILDCQKLRNDLAHELIDDNINETEFVIPRPSFFSLERRAVFYGLLAFAMTNGVKIKIV